jgi:hypothetical protein
MDFHEFLLKLLVERPAALLTLVATLVFVVWNAAVTWTGFRQVSARMVTKEDLRVAIAELRDSIHRWLADNYVARRELDLGLREIEKRLGRLEQAILRS